MLTSVEPILACQDLAATLQFYSDELGFKVRWTHGEPPSHACAGLGAVSLMFTQNPDLAARIAGQELFLSCSEIERVYEDHQRVGAPIVCPMQRQPWGRDEYTVEDPNGYRLRFSGIAAEERTSAPFPPEVTIENRLPTPQEYTDLLQAEFPDVPGILARSCAGTVAVLPTGEAIGMARAVCDAPGWLSVWDVQVKEDWQGRHIGSRLMEDLLDQLRPNHTGAFVFLFTFRHGFYAKLGFGAQGVTMMQL